MSTLKRLNPRLRKSRQQRVTDRNVYFNKARAAGVTTVLGCVYFAAARALEQLRNDTTRSAADKERIAQQIAAEVRLNEFTQAKGPVQAEAPSV
jgi:hypothetical protein